MNQPFVQSIELSQEHSFHKATSNTVRKSAESMNTSNEFLYQSHEWNYTFAELISQPKESIDQSSESVDIFYEFINESMNSLRYATRR